MVDSTHSEPPGSGSSAGSAASLVPGWRRRLVRWLKRLIATAVFLLVVFGALLVVAEHRTSKPEFCGSCHIMEPYYESWHADPHGGKLEVACVECHYAPGERTTLAAKLRGLSQVTSYVSGRYGTARPRAHVDNLSCMTSKCHGDMKFMEKEISLGTVKFTHAKHLKFDDQKKEAMRRELDEMTAALLQLLGKEHLAQVEEVARLAIPLQGRAEQMNKLVEKSGQKVEPQQLARFSHLHHQQVRIDQLADLQCTNCHSYVSPLATKGGERHPEKGPPHHFTVKTTSCYTCHFKNEGFNTGSARCLMCHTLPTKEVMVHPELGPTDSARLKTPELAKQPVKMNHQAMLERKVDCFSCHADVAIEHSKVTRRDCERCHDRPEYYRQWKEPFSLDLVKHYHSAHVPGQHAKCLDCHTEIHHQLVRGQTPAGQPEFLSTVMANCTHCHPNHHTEQLKLLSGIGGLGVPKGDPNLMFGSRTNCFGCHVEQATKEHAGVVARGSVSGCISCHGDRHSETFEKWKKSLQVLLLDADEAYANAQKMLQMARDADPEARANATALLSAAQSDLRLVKRGNGVHNLMYSLELLDSVTRRCQQAMALLAKKGGG